MLHKVLFRFSMRETEKQGKSLVGNVAQEVQCVHSKETMISALQSTAKNDTISLQDDELTRK